MSAAISQTRAAAPRLAIRTLGRARLASTQAADAISSNRSMVIETAPVTKTTTTPVAKPSSPRRTPTLAERMHKALYPELYIGGKPVEGVQVAKAKKSGENKKTRNKAHGLTLPRPAPPIKKTCPHPVSTVTSASLAALDPTGARTRLFDRNNPESAKLGDILLVRQRTGDPFAGVCINIRRRGVDTAILLRGQLTRVGVEMWYKIYSPLVEGIEVVQRAAKRARRARLTYMRDVKHDRGSVENVVRVYLRQKASLGAGEKKKSGVEKQKAMQGGKKKGGKKVSRR
ncbi:hypothetical protein E8E13_008472 [Curvularia kusanoi]|uniref:Uncharacterized protein n=1 Tax=Curvularia kusanoi TaxID=90978 RepID=A0A9P4TNJ3_CURKU|nr:hypothetical protein E8E13_008472 [Curvularia kusanoi]